MRTSVLRLSDIKCEKYPVHEEVFFSVKDYKGQGLPADYQRDPDLIKHVKNQAGITVLLNISGTSQHRSEYSSTYPFSDKKYRHSVITGSGWLDRVSDYERKQPCPCSECKKSGSLHNGWAEIEICTAAHIVFDKDEGSRTECIFDYDTEEEDYDKSCDKLCNAVGVMVSPAADVSQLTLVCHDENFSDRLRNIYRTHSEHALRLMKKYNGPDLPRRAKLDQLRKALKKVMRVQKRLLSKTTDIKDGDKLILASLRHDNSEAYELDDSIAKLVSTVEAMDEPSFYSQYDCYGNMIKRFAVKIQHVKYILNQEVTSPSDVNQYNTAHPLTIIVSHPHGCSKRISIGEVIEKSSQDDGLFSQYTYTTPTCPGSSGALVFTLGQGLTLPNHPHSESRFVGPPRNDHLSRSGLIYGVPD